MSVAMLCLLPGLDGTGRLFAPFIDAALQAGFSTVKSLAYPADRVLDYSALEALVRGALPVGTPYVLLGESFSGPVALAIAADPPPDLRGLVLSTSFAASPLPMSGSLARIAPHVPMRPPMTLLSWWLLGRWATPTLREALQATLDTVPLDVLRARVALALGTEPQVAAKRMAAIRVPTLYLCAESDRLLPRSAGAGIVDSIADARLERIDGPHLLLQTRARLCAERIADRFLSRSTTS